MITEMNKLRKDLTGLRNALIDACNIVNTNDPLGHKETTILEKRLEKAWLIFDRLETDLLDNQY